MVQCLDQYPDNLKGDWVKISVKPFRSLVVQPRRLPRLWRYVNCAPGRYLLCEVPEKMAVEVASCIEPK